MGLRRIKRPHRGQALSAAAADAAQAFVHPVVFPPHLLQLLQRGVARRLGFPFRRKRDGLTLVTGLALGLLREKPALLERGRGRSRAEHERRHEGHSKRRPPHSLAMMKYSFAHSGLTETL